MKYEDIINYLLVAGILKLYNFEDLKMLLVVLYMFCLLTKFVVESDLLCNLKTFINKGNYGV